MKQQPSIPRDVQGAAKSTLVAQQGMSLIMVMLIMVVVAMLGISGVQIAMMAERGARNDRDMQIAFQAAEAALLDAEFDITNKNTSTARATKPFSKANIATSFLPDCGSSGDLLGLCKGEEKNIVPSWLIVDFTDKSASASTVEFGKFTGREFPVGTAGIQPSKKPRYIIEWLKDAVSVTRDAATGKSTENSSFYFRVTAMGFGPRPDIQVILQTVYRYSDPKDLE